MSPLRRLDDDLLPKAADRLARLLGAARGQRDAVAGRLRPPAPGSARTRLQRLDDRYASSGPLAVVRDVPQLGLLLVASVVLAASGAALSQQRPRPARVADLAPVPGQEPILGRPASLGPEVGRAVADYVAATRRQLVELSRTDPDGRRLALVSFSAYQTPAQAVALLAGLEVQRVYLRARAAGAEAALLPVEVTDLTPDLQRSYRQTAVGRAVAQQDYLRYVRTIDGVTQDEKAFKALYAALARSAGIEAAAYRSGCDCVLAAVVQAPARALAELPALSGVRAVEVAPAGTALPGTGVMPLLPEVTTVVPRPTVRAAG